MGALVYLVNQSSGQYLDANADMTIDQSVRPCADDQWIFDYTADGAVVSNGLRPGLLRGVDRTVDLGEEGARDSSVVWTVDVVAQGQLDGPADGPIVTLRNVGNDRYLAASDDVNDRGDGVVFLSDVALPGSLAERWEMRLGPRPGDACDWNRRGRTLHR